MQGFDEIHKEIDQGRFLALVNERYTAASHELVDALSRQMSALLQQHWDEAGKTAEKLVNEASDFIDNRM